MLESERNLTFKQNMKHLFRAHLLIVIKRFGLPLSFFAMLTLQLVLLINADLDGKAFWFQCIAQSLFASGLCLIGVSTLSETKKWPRSAYYSVSFALILGIFALHWAPPPFAQYSLLLLGLYVFLFVAPFVLEEHAQNDTIFVYLYRLSIAGIFAGLTTTVIFLGVFSLQGLVTVLFEFPFSFKITLTILTLLAGLCAPCIALASVPLKVQALNITHLPTRASYIFSFVLIPLVLIYAGTIYVYALKIGASRVTPQGVLAYFTLGFAIVGVIAHWYVSSIPHPKGFLYFYKQAFPWLFLLPLGLLIWSIYLRVLQYGLTPARYSVVLMTIWLFCITLYSLLYRQHNLRFSLLLLLALSLVGALGPLSVNNVTLMSQKKRLMSLLEKHGLVEQGEMIKISKDVPLEDRKSIASCLYSIHSVGRLADLAPLFPAENLKGLSYRDLHNLLADRGIKAR